MSWQKYETAGEHYVFDDDGSHDGDGHDVARVFDGANARLIAAAPDLLAAVSELLDSLDAIYPELEEELKASADNTTSQFGAGLIHSYRIATAALKNATGGEA